MPLSVFRSLDLAGRALSAQRTRLDVVSSNLANAQTTRADGEPGYRRRDVLLRAVRAGNAYERAAGAGDRRLPSTVEVQAIREDDAEPRMVYDPSHPHANEDGFVAYPNVNTVEEMVDMITAMRSYQANLSVLKTTKDLAQRALSIGRGT